MALVRLLRGGQVTLPAAVRERLKLAQGDYLEAEVVEDGVLLKPVPDVEREKAWQRVLDAPKGVRYIGPEPRPSPECAGGSRGADDPGGCRIRSGASAHWGRR